MARKVDHITIQPAKGRPMLHWVGKQPLARVPAFPAQHLETFDPSGALADRTRAGWDNWPERYPFGGLLFHGDNKEVLGHLLANGFRGKVKLIYIDPPFDSGADYVRRVQLRGATGTGKLEGEDYSLGEQIQYTDIWANDNYLQFMYERLLLLRELLAEDSTIFVHTDPGRSYQVRCVLDEVFGAGAFRNEIVWWYWNKMQGNVNRFASNHDVIICYQKGSPVFHKIREEREDVVRQLKRVWDPASGSLVNAKDADGNLIYIESEEKTVDDVWRIPMLQPADQTENTRFPTQKPEDLLSIVVAASTNPHDLVLDCFIGSGTTAAVAQKLGRRWIGCDINKGAIQTTSKRLQSIIREELAAAGAEAGAQQELLAAEDGGAASSPTPAQLGFTVWRVNDYDLQIQHNEAVELACEHLGVERTRSDAFFDGVRGKQLVKIVPFGHPLTPLDLEEVKRELEARPEEDRDVLVVCLGTELAADAWLEAWNRHRRKGDVPNKIEVIELRTDRRYGGFLAHEPATARVKVERRNGEIVVAVEDFISPTIVERLEMDAQLFRAKIPDWRSMVDCVMIDASYDGEVFDVTLSDVPERKNDLVAGVYELDAPDGRTTVAVKLIDMLGEEVLVTVEV